MKITVDKDNVKIEEFDIVHEGEHRVNKCSFSFSEEYTEDLVKKAIFTSQNSSIEVVIINNECDIPTEILRARNIVLLGVYAYKVTEDKLDLRYSPSPDAFKVNSGSYIEDANESEKITATQFEQYMQAMNDGLNKVEESLKKMDSATSSATQLVDNINQKLENGDFIGPEGPQGPQGVPGKDGTNGTNGQDGVGITTITSGQSTIEQDKTITPVTVQKSDGSSESFNVEAKNGIDGQNGQDGLTPSIGANGNWFIGDTDTGKPSRGEVGPTPDLSDYVKNTDYANASKAGVLKINGNAARISSDGVLSAAEVSEEQYKTTVNSIFISKGTLDNVKNFLVESSTPVQDLTSTVTNIQEEQDESKPKNTASGEIVSVNDAIAYKTFNVTVDGASEQETTTGKNNLNNTLISQTLNGLNIQINEDKSVKIQGTANKNTNIVLNRKPEINTGTYTLYGCKTFIESEENNGWWNADNEPVTKTFTTKPILSSQGFFIYIENGQAVNKTYYPMLLKGTYTNENIGDYEPYTGGQPSPSPDFPQPITSLSFNKITRCGKNIFDYNKFLGDIGDSLIIEGTNNNFTYTCNSSIPSILGTFKFNFKEKISYSFSGKISSSSANGAMKVIYTDETSFYIYSKWDGSSLSQEFFKTTDGTKTIKQIELTSYGNGTVFELTDFMISEGSQATDYEPYQGQTYDIDLQGNEMVELPNGAKDDLVIDKYGNVSLVKNTGKVVYTNNNNFNKNGQNEKRIQYLTPIIENIPLNYGDQLDNIFQSNVISSIYVQDGTSFAGTTATSKIRVSISRDCLNIQEESNSGYLNALNELLQKLNESGNPFTIYYPLATPQTIPLGKLTDIITTLNGTNNILINGNIPTTISTTYALDIKKYIDNKLAEISTAMIEEG